LDLRPKFLALALALKPQALTLALYLVALLTSLGNKYALAGSVHDEDKISNCDYDTDDTIIAV